MIEYRNGDLFAGSEKICIHGCNAQGKYASGFAGVVRGTYPAAYDAYMASYKAGTLVLGSLSWAVCDGRLIVNAVTQKFFGRDGKRYVDYNAVRQAFSGLNSLVLSIQNGERIFVELGSDISTVAMPKIGAGLAGGDWNVIAEIIEEEAISFQPIVYVI